MEIGQWVKFKSKGKTYTGYVKGIRKNYAAVVITAPLGTYVRGKEYGFKVSELTPLNYIKPHPDDMDTLINFTLENNEKEWFKDIIKRHKAKGEAV